MADIQPQTRNGDGYCILLAAALFGALASAGGAATAIAKWPASRHKTAQEADTRALPPTMPDR